MFFDDAVHELLVLLDASSHKTRECVSVVAKVNNGGPQNCIAMHVGRIMSELKRNKDVTRGVACRSSLTTCNDSYEAYYTAVIASDM